MRGQLSLPALGFALLVLTAVTVLGVAVADGAVGSAERSALDRQAAVTLSDRLVSANGPLSVRANVLNATALAALNETTLQTAYGLGNDTDVRVSLDSEPLVSTGSPDGGRSIERLVLVRERHTRTLTPAFVGADSVTLPRRTPRIRLDLDPATNNSIPTVRVGDRVVLHNESGLRGTFTVPATRYETATLAFDSTTALQQGSVRITYYPVETHKARLGVTVDG